MKPSVVNGLLLTCAAVILMVYAANGSGPLSVWSGFFSVLCILGCGASFERALFGRRSR